MFKKDGYTIIKKAIDPELADFLFYYFLLKRQAAATMFDSKFLSPFTLEWGRWDDPQVPGTYSIYGDVAFETLLYKLLDVMQKTTDKELYCNYSYARIYKNGDVLKRHKDRYSCELSTTLFLGGDKWPIYLSKNPKDGKHTDKGYQASKAKGIKVDLNPGDMLVYRGCDLEHWRDEFKGEDCAQVFLHYTDKKNKGAKENEFDGRPHLGLPSKFKKGV